MIMITIWDTNQDNGLIIFQQRRIRKYVIVHLASYVIQTKRHKLGDKGKERPVVYRESILRDFLCFRVTMCYYNWSKKEELSWLS